MSEQLQEQEPLQEQVATELKEVVALLEKALEAHGITVKQFFEENGYGGNTNETRL